MRRKRAGRQTVERDRAAGVVLLDRPADRAGERHDPFGRIGDTVEPGHDRIGIGDQFVAARRTNAAELHRRVRMRLRAATKTLATSSVETVANGFSAGA